MFILVYMIVSFGISAAVLLALFPVATRLGLMDHPNERRKIHAQPVPLIGGIAIYAAIVAAGLMAGHGGDQAFVFAAAGATVLVIVGGLDDRFGLGYKIRLGSQIVAALLLAASAEIRLEGLGDLLGFGPIDLGLAAIAFTVFAVVGVINAFNMIDGIDGLAGGLALVALIALWTVGLPSGGTMAFVVPAAVAAIIPYLSCNLGLPGCRRRKVFLGDSGSMLLGYIVAWSLIQAAGTDPGIQPVTALWLAAIPLLDTFTVMTRRLWRKSSPFAADRSHLHHVLSRWFGSSRTALAVLLSASLGLAGFGLLGETMGLSEPAMFYAALLVFTALLLGRRNLHRAYAAAARRRRDKGRILPRERLEYGFDNE